MKYLILILIFLPLPILTTLNMPTRLENIINTGSTNPNAKPNRAFLNGLYLEFHGRNATDKEMERFKNIRVWDVSNIVAGKQILKRQQVSPKANDQDVKELYWKYYVRKPSKAELNNWGSVGGKDATKEALKNFLVSGIPKGIVPWKSDYTGKRYENEVNITGENLRNKQIAGDYFTRYKAKTPINLNINNGIPDEFILSALPNEQNWLNKNKNIVNGLYNKNIDKMYVKDVDDDYFFINNLTHELGHNFDEDYKISNNKNLFNENISGDRISLSNDLTGQQKNENIANNFSLYAQDAERYRKENSKEYDYFEKTLKIPDEFITQ